MLKAVGYRQLSFPDSTKTDWSVEDLSHHESAAEFSRAAKTGTDAES